jgi:hypothetical protein
VPGVRAQLAPERDPANPRRSRQSRSAGGIEAGATAHPAPPASRRGAGARGRDDQEVDGRDRPVGRGWRRAPVRRRPVGLRHARLSRPRRAWPRWRAHRRPCTAC